MMTNTAIQRDRQRSNRRSTVLLTAVASLFLILALVFATIAALRSSNTNPLKENPRDFQQEMLQRLEEDRGEYDEQSIVLSGSNLSTARQLAERLGAELRITKDGRFAKLTLPTGLSIIDVCSDDTYLEDIPRMSIDYRVTVSELDGEQGVSNAPTASRPDYTVSDSSYSLQTYLDYINMQSVWSTVNGSGVTVAIIDTGIDTDHPEFTGRISEYSYNASKDKIVKDCVLENGSYDWSLIEDEQGHGTAVAGVIAGSMNSGEIVGIAPMADILVIKAECTEDGIFNNASDLIFGLYYAIERDVSVVNMSFGVETDDERFNIFKEPALLAKDSDVICVAAAGNNATAALTYPAADPNVFGVGALGEDSWELAAYSNYGENVNLVAPGTTYTSVMGGGCGSISGTSMASPVVAGSIALYLNQNTYQEFLTVEQILYASCKDLGDLGGDWYYGYGALDVSALILEERGTVSFDMLSDELENTEQLFIKNHTLQNMPEPERLYAVFDGWYYDPQCTEEYNWYTDKFSSDLTLYAGWINEDDGIPYIYVELEDGTVEIRSYTGKRRYITIPDYIEGKAVSSIGRAAFSGNTNLRQVNLPKHLVNIHDLAFEGCASLVSISIPDTVTNIGERAFYDNIRLSSVSFGASSQLKAIGEKAFSGCIKLRSFTVPAAVIQLAESAFYRSTSIQSFAVQAGNRFFTAVDGCLCSADATRLICYPYGRTASARIPSSVTTLGTYSFRYGRLQGIESWGAAHTIEERAFEHSSIKATLSIPDQITSMGEYAFAQSSYILKVVFGTGLTEIPEFAFYECSSIRSLELSDSIQTIGSSAFNLCVMLSELDVPAGVEKIGGAAFLQCYQLKELTFAQDAKLKEIDGSAFMLTSVERADFPASLEKIGGSAFSWTTLTSITFPENSALKTIGDNAFEKTGIGQVTFPEGLVYLGDYAFSETSIREILIPKNVSHFGGGVFASCPNLTAIEISEENPYYNDIDGVVYTESGDKIVGYPSGNINRSYEILAGVQSVGAAAFAGSFYLENVTIPEGNQEIEKGAFSDSSVVTVTVGDGLKSIGMNAFLYAQRLTAINLPEGLTKVEPDAFFGTESLIELVIPESLSVLTEGSFRGCGARRYTLPSSLTEIQTEALAYNQNLQYIDIPDNVVQIGKYAFYKNLSMANVNFTATSKLPRISYGAFAHCGLTSFLVPANVSTIAQDAFEGCKQLTAMTFAAGSRLESISAYMFDGCSNLTSIVFESGSALTSIQAHGLEGMTKLTSVDFGDAKLTNVDNFAFRFCESLTEIILPEGVTNIGRFAFYDCTALADVTLPSTLDHIGRFAFLGAEKVQLYFASETLPPHLDENWDHGIAGYYLGVEDVTTEGDWKYATLTEGGVALIAYLGSDTAIDLTSLDFGAEIVNIGGKCFAYSTLEKIVLPDTVVTVQAEAFYHSMLKEITVPRSVQFIGRSAFADTPIKTLTFAADAHLSVMEQSAFEGTAQLEAVTLPASITTLGSAVFKNSGIASVQFANGIRITEIPEEAFAYTNITAVSIPDGVSLINHGAFRETEHLKEVVFGQSAELRIMSNVFYQSGLEQVCIPKNVTYIGEYAFIALNNLTAFEVEQGNLYYTAVDGVLMGSGGRKLIAMPAGRTGSYTVPLQVESIGFGAFEETALSEVLFLEDANILTIGYRAFYKAEHLTRMQIPASVISIDFYAFANCTSLQSVTFAQDSGLTGVYEGAFYGCKNLDDIVLPDSIMEISDFAFYGCQKLTKIPVTEESQLKGIFGYAMAYTGLAGEFTLPETLIDIGEYAFMGTRLTKITIPNTNEWDLVIGIGAFEDCQNVSEITLPFVGASLDDPNIGWMGYIFGAGAFEANDIYFPKGLKKVTITGNVTELGEGAFYNLSAITEIHLPDSIAVLGDNSFQGFTARYTLTGPVLGKSLNIYRYPEYTVNATMFGKNYYGHLTLDEGIATIPHGAFWDCASMTGITIPDSVTFIDGWAFYGCKNLETVILGAGLCDLNPQAFLNSNVAHFEISADHPYFQVIDEVIYDKPATTLICTAKKLPGRVRVPQGVTIIPTDAFESNTVTDIILPDSLKTISGYAFRCPNLISVTLGAGLESIEEGAFVTCDRLSMIHNNSALSLTIGGQDHGGIAAHAQIIILANGDQIYADPSGEAEIIDTADGFRFMRRNGEYTLIAHFGDENSITLPEKINESSYTVQRFSSAAEQICVPDGITDIAEKAFDTCGSLKRITVTESNTHYMALDGILYRADSNSLISVPMRISGCVTIPEDVRAIPSNAFADRGDLTEITFSSGTEEIGFHAFFNCHKLARVVFSDTIVSIGDSAFGSCASLIEVDLPDSMTEVPVSCFYGCTSLERIDLPKNLKVIDAFAFTDCFSLKEVGTYEGLETINGMAFLRCSDQLRIELPTTIRSIDRTAFDAYAELIFPDSTVYADGIAYSEALDNIIYIPEYLSGKVTIPYGVTSIPDFAFASTSLTEIVIPDSVTKIGDHAFNRCEKLKRVVLPSKLTQIGVSLFDWCTSLTEISIPEGVTSIGEYTFYGCSSLVNLTLPQSLEKIGASAFEGCTSLQALHLSKNLKECQTGAFNNCPALAITVDEGFSLWKNIDGIWYDKDVTKIIYAPVDIRGKLTVADGIADIGNAFSYCPSITEIVLPDSMTGYLNSASFGGCSSLTKITVSDTHPTYTSVNGVLYNKSKTELVAIPTGYNQTLVIEEGVTSIGGNFNSLNGISAIVLPSTLTRIEDFNLMYLGIEMIYNNSPLQLTFGEMMENGGVAYTAKIIVEKDGNRRYANGVTDYDIFTTEDGFEWKRENGTYYLTGYVGSESSVTLPTQINGSPYLLYEFDGAEHVTIPQGWTEISAFAFSESGTLKSISLPKTVTVIGERAFYMCTQLQAITLHEGIERIESLGFAYCRSLTEIQFPTTLTYVGHSAFLECAFESVTVPATITEFGENVFEGCKKLSTVTLEPGLVQLPGFKHCTALKQISIPDSVVDIGSFEGCNGLTQIKLPDGVTSIKGFAFCDCSSLATITVGDGITHIGEQAFYNTAFYNNSDNWSNGILYLHRYLIRVSEDLKYFDCKEDIKCAASDAYKNCRKLKIAYVFGEGIEMLSSVTNIETLVIQEKMPSSIYYYFGYEFKLPLTLKNVIIGEDVKMTNHAFGDEWSGWITGLHIFVEESKKDTMWDENYPYWQNGNRVYYEGKWIYSSFYDKDGALTVKAPIPSTQIIRIPWTDHYYDDNYAYVFQGYDIDSDGIADSVPATSTVHISAAAIYEKLHRCDFEGHLPMVDAASAPTCTETGLTEGSHCDRCGTTLVAQTVVPMLGHSSVVDAAVKPTCTETGLTEGSHCDRCGETLVAQTVVPNLGHSSVVDAAVKPTCTETGLTEGSHCDRCGTILVAQTVVPMLGHHAVTDAASAPTCTETGLTEGSHCDRCGTILVAQTVVPMLGHSSVVDAAIEPTCTETGLTEGSHCDRCGTTLVAQTVVPMLGHHAVTDAASAPTCTETGLTEGSHCDRCGTTLVAQTVVPMLGHHTVTDAAVAPTCTETGLTEGSHCDRCGEILVAQTVVPMLGHNSVVDAAIEPTCTETGLTEGSHCDRCGTTLVAQTVVPMLGHSSVVDAAVAPTCSETGLTEGSHCDRCGTTLVAQTVVPMLGHHAVTDAAVAPTCTETGLTEGSHCDRCGTILVAQTVVPNLGHHAVTDAAVAPTCTQTGLTEGSHCDRCGETLVTQTVVPMLGHSFTHYVSNNDATEIKDGTKTAKCDRCDETDTVTDVGSALGYTKAFEDAVNALTKDAPAEVAYSELRNALMIYASLNDEEKEKVSDSYEKLQKAIEDYNQTASVANNELAKASELSFSAIATFHFAFLSVLWYLLKEKFFLGGK